VHLHAVTVVVDEYDAAIGHYVGDLGFVLLEDTRLTADKRWVRVSPDGQDRPSLLLARASTAAQREAIGNQAGGRVGFFLHVEDFAAYHRRLVSAGVAVVDGPRVEPYGTVAVFRDRYGNLWDVIQPPSDLA
jgi:catechol 2,3-dioxygenase-like lactoylglutathione lyase family enzyme